MNILFNIAMNSLILLLNFYKSNIFTKIFKLKLTLNLLIIRIYSFIFTVLFLILWTLQPVFAQNQVVNLNNNSDSIKLNGNDSLLISNDTVFINPSTSDTIKKKKSNPIEAKVVYKSTDSLRFNIRNKKVFLFSKAEVSYQQINLKSDYVDMNFTKNEVFAKGVADSNGIFEGNPVFKEGEKSFDAKELLYNFNSKKGLIKHVITKESEGYVHGEQVKKMADDITFIRHGSFTTCDLEHPHFDIRFGKAKVIPDKKIVTGPAFLYLEDIPTPLFVPLGYFPNTKNQSSGILFPTYGESPNRGFFFENGGYYFALSDYIDLALRGDIYTRGSWALRSNSNYNRRYKYNGSFSLDYASNRYGEENTPDYSKSTDFSLRWSHNQDPKAHPTSRFSTNVNLVSSNYNQFSTNASDFLTNTTNSSISYSTSFGGNYFLTVDLGESYNNNTRIIDLNLPTIALNVNRFYPFRKKNQTGDLSWYENISINYALNAQNKINTHDSLLFTQTMVDKMQNGIRHSIPISSSIKILNYFTLTNSINIGERWYFKTVHKEWIYDSLYTATDTVFGYEKVTDDKGFARAMDFVVSSSLSTRFYGMLQLKKGPVRALRHVVSPSVSFSWRPDFGEPQWGYFDSYINGNTGKEIKYSRFENSLYGGPPDGKYGNIAFSVGNNLEMKVRSKKDTITGMKKIILIENFSLSTSYNLSLDSLNWAPISMSGRTTLLKNISLNYSSVWDPYVKNTNGSRLNQYEWDINKRLLRLDNTQWNVGLNLNLNPSTFKKKLQATTNQDVLPKPISQSPVSNINETLGEHVDFNIPWNLNISYTFNYSSVYDAKFINYDKNYIQTLSFSGDINLTSKWKFGFRSGYDFELKDFSYTSFDIYRDLHCWEMRFNWIPFGFRQSWSFTINVKATVLKDLKWDKKKDFRDRVQ